MACSPTLPPPSRGGGAPGGRGRSRSSESSARCGACACLLLSTTPRSIGRGEIFDSMMCLENRKCHVVFCFSYGTLVVHIVWSVIYIYLCGVCDLYWTFRRICTTGTGGKGGKGGKGGCWSERVWTVSEEDEEILMGLWGREFGGKGID